MVAEKFTSGYQAMSPNGQLITLTQTPSLNVDPTTLYTIMTNVGPPIQTLLEITIIDWSLNQPWHKCN